MHIDKGDFLTFASIAASFDLLPDDDLETLNQCEIEPGIFRRHPEVIPGVDSRSDISRDGYLGHLFRLMRMPVEERNPRLDNVIKAMQETNCQVGDYGSAAYTNIWPLYLIYLAARHGEKVFTPPVFVFKPYATGFRAHLIALYIHIEMLIGKKRWSHRRSLKTLVNYNPRNPWFLALFCKAKGRKLNQKVFEKLLGKLDIEQHAGTGWGGCPNSVLVALSNHLLGSPKAQR